MKTVLDVLTLSTKHLQQKTIPNARRESEELIAHALQMPRLDLYMQFDRPLTEVELDKCRQFLIRRANHEPAEYITGFVEFYHCKIEVDRSVLIPRPETEILVDLIAKDLSTQDLSSKTLLDLCCGSGCIGIALKKRFPNLRVILSDISSEALLNAKKNAYQNEVSIEFLEGDLLVPLAGQKIDYLVCNPPYVTEAEYAQLDTSVKAYEPKLALVAGQTGLELYKTLARDLKSHLNQPYKIWLEIGTGQGTHLKTIFSSYGTVLVQPDWAGHDRFVSISSI